jgi:phage-related protein
MNKISDLRPLLWIASSKRDFVEMPDDVTDDFGHWLFQVQKGKVPKNAKALSGFGGAKIMELWKDNGDGTFRAIYTVKYSDVVIILHAFQKKSKKGIETPKQDKELIHSRIKLAEVVYREWKEKGSKND